MDEDQKKNKKTDNRKLIDYNCSWGTMLLLILYIGAIFFIQREVFTKQRVLSNQFAFHLLSLLLGVVIVTVLHNICKIIGAYIGGYKILYFNCFGLRIENHENKLKVKFSLSLDYLLTTSLRFVSKDEKEERNPLPIFLSGFAGDLLFIGICLLIFFLNNPQKGTLLSYYSIYVLLYGLSVTLYELLPVRQDEANDMYNIIRTHNEEDRIAYNLYYINISREMNGKDPIRHDFENYESFYRSQILYFNYLDKLYDNKLEEGLNYIKTLSEVEGYVPDNDKFLSSVELIYLRYLVGDEAEADKLFLSLKGDSKSSCLKENRLSVYRTSLLLHLYVIKDKQKIQIVINNFKKLLYTIDNRDSKRVVEEKKRFLESYQKVHQAYPEDFKETLNLD